MINIITFTPYHFEIFGKIALKNMSFSQNVYSKFLFKIKILNIYSKLDLFKILATGMRKLRTSNVQIFTINGKAVLNSKTTNPVTNYRKTI